MTRQSGKVARILYKELVEGDLRKLKAKSNDANTGGGARDFRFGSYKTLLPVIRLMFPQTVQEVRKRGGQSVMIDVFKGAFFWSDAQGNIHRKDAYFEPPTDVRPTEGRITRVHEYPCFDANSVEISAGNRILLLLIQRDDDSLWPYYVEEQSLHIPNVWHPVVATELLNCLNAVRPVNQAVIGYRDFISAAGYCNGQ